MIVNISKALTNKALLHIHSSCTPVSVSKRRIILMTFCPVVVPYYCFFKYNSDFTTLPPPSKYQ